MEHPWYAIMVKATREKGIGEVLERKGYQHFAPSYQIVRRYGRRTKKTTRALFPGYLFCRFDRSDRLPILKVPGVLRIVGDTTGPLPVDSGEIESIQRALDSPLKFEPWPFLQPGEWVEIIDGPLRGVQGTLHSFTGTARILLTVSLLNRSLAVEVERAIIRPIGTSAKRRPPSVQSVAKARIA